MKIYNYPCTLNVPTSVALGRFDGVHTAHRAVISSAAKKSAEGLTPAVFTFCDNPNKSSHFVLSTEEEKQKLIESCGTEIMVNATFESVRNLSAQEFVNLVLKESLNAKAVFCGYNYRFGKGAQSDVQVLKELCREAQIQVICVEEQVICDTTVSSSAIRALLSQGDAEKANKLLGRAYSLEGKVIHGNAIGRTMETPTLNLDVPKEKLLPRFGVYACYAHIDDKTYKAVANIGTKPTVGSEKPTIEAYLLDTKGDFYEKFVTLELIDFLRAEQKFENLQALRDAISKDIAKAEELL